MKAVIFDPNIIKEGYIAWDPNARDFKYRDGNEIKILGAGGGGGMTSWILESNSLGSIVVTDGITVDIDAGTTLDSVISGNTLTLNHQTFTGSVVNLTSGNIFTSLGLTDNGHTLLTGTAGIYLSYMKDVSDLSAFENDILQRRSSVWQGVAPSSLFTDPTGLEKITEGANTGFRIIGRVAANYAEIGSDAMDFSVSNSASSVMGASGLASVAFGLENQASGPYSFAGGQGCIASGTHSFAYGLECLASGTYSVAMGYKTKATKAYSTAFGNESQAVDGTAFVMGFRCQANGSNSFAGGNTWTYGFARVFGDTSFMFQEAKVTGMDIYSDNAVILGGVNNRSTSTSDRSVILGGQNQEAIQEDMVYIMGHKYDSYTQTEVDALANLEEGTVILNGDVVSLQQRKGTSWSTPSSFKGGWIGNQNAIFYTNDMVLDDGWLMSANKTTSDRPSPQPNGPATYTMPDEPVWPTLNNVSVIYSGQTYTFTKPGWIKRIRAWAPDLTTTTNYRFIIADITDPANPVYDIIEEPVLNEDDWTFIAIGSRIVKAGTVLKMYIDALDSSSTSNISGGWRYDGPDQTLCPATGGFNGDNQGTIVRIDKTDLDSVDRTSELLGVIPDSTISFVQTSDTSKSLLYLVNALPVDSGTCVSYSVSLVSTGTNGIPDVTEPCTTDIEIPIPTTTDYKQQTDTWLTQPSFATVTGFLEFDGVDQAGHANDGYGIDFLFQEAYISPDWDFMTFSSSGSGSSTVIPTLQQVAEEGNTTTTNVFFNNNIGTDLGLNNVIHGTDILTIYTGTGITFQNNIINGTNIFPAKTTPVIKNSIVNGEDLVVAGSAAATIQNSIINGIENANTSNNITSSLLIGSLNVDDGQYASVGNSVLIGHNNASDADATFNQNLYVGFQNWNRNSGAQENNLTVGYNNFFNTEGISKNNIAVGYYCGNAANAAVNNCVLFGTNAADDSTTLANTIAMGGEAFMTSTADLTDAIAIGWQAGKSTTFTGTALFGVQAQGTANNQIVIGSAFYTSGVRLFGDVEVTDAFVTENDITTTSGIFRVGTSNGITGTIDSTETLTIEGGIVTATTAANPVVVVNSATYTLVAGVKIVSVAYTATGACTITIPSALIGAEVIFSVKDAGFNAGQNNITIETEGAQTIDGDTNVIINLDKSAISLYADGSNVFIN